jgi:hypothetical protein
MKHQFKKRLRRLTLLVLLFLFFISSCSVPLNNKSKEGALVYRVAEHQHDPEMLTVSLTLPETVANGKTKLSARGIHLGVEPQIINVSCDGETIARDADHNWEVPQGCREIYWEVKLVSSDKSLMEISKQQSFIIKSDPPWILLSEFSFLPRVESGDHASVIEFDPALEKKVVSCLSKDGDGRRILPNKNEAPVFFVIGLDAPAYTSTSGISLKYLIDEKAVAETINAFRPMHMKSIEYMRSLLNASSDSDFNLNVVWLGLSKKAPISGAAGFRTFLINYFFIDGKLLKDKFIWSLMVAFHEQFHVLYYSEAFQPAWAGESLAQYYAIKTLEKVGFDPKLLLPIKVRFIQPSRKIEMGLKAANHKFKTQKDMSVYHLFYDQGATFWSELDGLILDSTRNKKSLDDFLGELSKMNFAEDGGLPKAFINTLTSNNVNGIESLIERYL